MWDIVVEDSTGVIFSNFLAQDNLTGLMISEVGPDVQFINPTFPIVEKSVLKGHEWSSYSEVENLLTYSEAFEQWNNTHLSISSP